MNLFQYLKYSSGSAYCMDNGEQDTSDQGKSREAGVEVGQEPGQGLLAGTVSSLLTSLLKRESLVDQP